MADNRLYCSFCGKRQEEVTILIAGPVSFICDECVILCLDIVIEKRRAAEERACLARQEADAAQKKWVDCLYELGKSR